MRVLKSWMEISAERLAHNFHAVQRAAGAAVEVVPVVKANGYGHGVAGVASALVGAGARWLGVTDVAEGLAVRQELAEGEGKTARLMVMCGMDAGDAEALVTHDLTQVVWTAEHVRWLDGAARAVGSTARVHLEVETGMGRQGAAAGPELAEVLEALAAAEFVECEGLMTHLCESEMAGSAVTKVQLEKFERAVAQVAAAGVRPKFLHIGNSSAVDEGSTMAWVLARAVVLGANAMVRPGYAIYGHCLPVEGGVGSVVRELLPVLTWKTRVIGVREVQAGATVGYGATFVAERAMRLALVPVGYADGFRRAASSGLGNGWVMIGGRRAAVVGRVSMNLTVVDVSGMAVNVGDEVVVLGEGVSAEDHAAWSGTIGYDVLCGIRARAGADVN